MGAKLAAYKPLSIQYFSCYQVWIDSSERNCHANCKSNRHQCDGGEETSAVLSLSFTSVSGISLMKQSCWLVECSLLLKYQHLCWKLCSIVIPAAIVLPPICQILLQSFEARASGLGFSTCIQQKIGFRATRLCASRCMCSLFLSFSVHSL